MIKTIVHSAGGGCGGGGGYGGGRADAGVYHTSGSTDNVGAAADEVPLPRAVGGGTTSEVRGDAQVMPCENLDLDTSTPTSFAIGHPALGTISPVTWIPSPLAFAFKQIRTRTTSSSTIGGGGRDADIHLVPHIR